MAGNPTIQPAGMAAATAGISIFLCIISTTVVWLRIWVRFGNKALGMDDYLMIAGWVSATREFDNQLNDTLIYSYNRYSS